MNSLKRFLLPPVVMAISLVIFMTLKNTKPEKTVTETPEKRWQVNTVNVDFKTYSPEVTLYGRVESPQKSVLKSALVADIVAVYALEGAHVKKGQLLVQLDDTDAKLTLEQRYADLEEVNALLKSEVKRVSRDRSVLEQEKSLLSLATKSVERIEALEQTRLVSQSNLEETRATQQRQMVTLKRLEFDIADHPARLAQLKARQKRSQALVQQAKVNIQRTQISAPFDGRISTLYVAKGDRVRAGDSILAVYDLSQLEVRAEIPGRYITQIQTMMATEKVLNAVAVIAGQQSDLSLERLSGEVKQNSAGIDGLFRVNNKQESLVLGSFVELTLTLKQYDQLVAIPYNTLYGLNHVYKLQDGYLQRIDVTRVGNVANEQGEKQLLIRSDGLKQGDELVSTQLPNAMSGLPAEAIK